MALSSVTRLLALCLFAATARAETQVNLELRSNIDGQLTAGARPATLGAKRRRESYSAVIFSL